RPPSTKKAPPAAGPARPLGKALAGCRLDPAGYLSAGGTPRLQGDSARDAASRIRDAPPGRWGMWDRGVGPTRGVPCSRRAAWHTAGAVAGQVSDDLPLRGRAGVRVRPRARQSLSAPDRWMSRSPRTNRDRLPASTPEASLR